jgi:hypothetical protein
MHKDKLRRQLGKTRSATPPCRISDILCFPATLGHEHEEHIEENATDRPTAYEPFCQVFGRRFFTCSRVVSVSLGGATGIGFVSRGLGLRGVLSGAPTPVREL